ncbi:MAG: aminopeptidase, partial [Candidatus Aenigmatarchaeota archaeon]
MTYTPSRKILDKYADLLVNFALWKGKGVKPGEVVLLQVPECAKPLLVSLQRAVLKAGAHPILQFLPDGIMKDFFEISTEEQAAFFPMKYMKCRVDTIDHLISVFATTDPFELSKSDPK